MSNSGEVSGNGMNMTDSFDVAFYIKGDMKPVNLYDAELLMEYEEVTINDASTTIKGTIFENTLVGKGSCAFRGDLAGHSDNTRPPKPGHPATFGAPR